MNIGYFRVNFPESSAPERLSATPASGGVRMGSTGFWNGGYPVRSKPLAKAAGGSSTLPLEERIRLRAHQLYIERGNESGSEIEDWLQAEEELSATEEERVERD